MSSPKKKKLKLKQTTISGIFSQNREENCARPTGGDCEEQATRDSGKYRATKIKYSVLCSIDCVCYLSLRCAYSYSHSYRLDDSIRMRMND